MDRAEFQAVVEQALDALPEEFARRLENIAVMIEDEPSPALLHSLGLDARSDTVFGVYAGVPLGERGISYSGVLPDTISIFYRPLVQAFRSPDRIRREITKTVIHEIAHYFGIDDDTIEDLGY